MLEITIMMMIAVVMILLQNYWNITRQNVLILNDEHVLLCFIKYLITMMEKRRKKKCANKTTISIEQFLCILHKHIIL